MIIPCNKNKKLGNLIQNYSEELKQRAHELGNHGLSDREFYDSGLFRGAIERIRGQFAATTSGKHEFVETILEHLKATGKIKSWTSSSSSNRHDFIVEMPNGRTTAIELKGCLDGNNTNIFERPPNAHEFIIWSLCTNPGADPQKNAWSGIHTRLSAEIISRGQRVDGVVIWDMVCGTLGRPCPKLIADPSRATQIDEFQVPPPCIYLFPNTIPSPRNNARPKAQSLNEVQFLSALHEEFNGSDDEIYQVSFEVEHADADTVRKTTVRRNGEIVKVSKMTPIRRA